MNRISVDQYLGRIDEMLASCGGDLGYQAANLQIALDDVYREERGGCRHFDGFWCAAVILALSARLIKVKDRISDNIIKANAELVA